MTPLDKNQLLSYLSPVKDDLDEFDRKLKDHLKGDSPLISSIARHLLHTKGKRIRPAFVFLSSRAMGNFNEFSVDASLAIELIHTATLLHDDVVDESDIRRGKETVNYKWKNLISVLMGDYIFAKAFRVMVEPGSMELIDAISQATERVAVGELRQIEETNNYGLTEEVYLEIIADKTASLFSVACETGPILMKRSAEARQKMAEFGESIGIAFQIADDLLDFEGDPKVTGKELGNDVMSGKVTLPLIYALDSVGEERADEMIEFIQASSESGDQAAFDKIQKFVEEQGGIEYTYKRAADYCDRAMDALGEVEDSVYAESLINMVRYTAARSA